MAENNSVKGSLQWTDEYGLGGETIDLHTAYIYYKEKLNEQSSEERSNHLKELHIKIYDNPLPSTNKKCFLQRLKSIFKR